MLYIQWLPWSIWLEHSNVPVFSWHISQQYFFQLRGPVIACNNSVGNLTLENHFTSCILKNPVETIRILVIVVYCVLRVEGGTFFYVLTSNDI